jgi:hypothetical protein
MHKVVLVFPVMFGLSTLAYSHTHLRPQNVDMNQILDVPGMCDTLTELFKARVMQYPPYTSLDSDQKYGN